MGIAEGGRNRSVARVLASAAVAMVVFHAGVALAQPCESTSVSVKQLGGLDVAPTRWVEVSRHSPAGPSGGGGEIALYSCTKDSCVRHSKARLPEVFQCTTAKPDQWEAEFVESLARSVNDVVGSRLEAKFVVNGSGLVEEKWIRDKLKSRGTVPPPADPLETMVDWAANDVIVALQGVEKSRIDQESEARKAMQTHLWIAWGCSVAFVTLLLSAVGALVWRVSNRVDQQWTQTLQLMRQALERGPKAGHAAEPAPRGESRSVLPKAVENQPQVGFPAVDPVQPPGTKPPTAKPRQAPPKCFFSDVTPNDRDFLITLVVAHRNADKNGVDPTASAVARGVLEKSMKLFDILQSDKAWVIDAIFSEYARIAKYGGEYIGSLLPGHEINADLIFGRLEWMVNRVWEYATEEGIDLYVPTIGGAGDGYEDVNPQRPSAVVGTVFALANRHGIRDTQVIDVRRVGWRKGQMSQPAFVTKQWLGNPW